MTPNELLTWRIKTMDWTQKKAAKKLGVTVTTYQSYELGKNLQTDAPKEVPKAIGLACLYLTSVKQGALVIQDEPVDAEDKKGFGPEDLEEVFDMLRTILASTENG